MESPTTELWRATLRGDYAHCCALICSGADVKNRLQTQSCLRSDAVFCNFDPMTTLLHVAVVSNNVEFVHQLIIHGANCNAQDSSKRTPLHYAIASMVYPEVVDNLIYGGAIVDVFNKEQFTPLHKAVILGSNQLALILINRGASINVTDAMGRNSLHLAALHKNLTMAKVLISHKLNIDAEDRSGFTALHYALKCCHITKILLDNGADMNKKTPKGNFPLFFAAMDDFQASLHLLLRRGARINERTNRGNTALHIACWKRRNGVVALLLKYGADINTRNNEGKTPLELLAVKESSEATANIVIAEAVKREALGEPLCERYIKTVQSRENYSNFDQECREEVNRMRSERINVENSTVSVIRLFLIKEDKLAALVRNKSIVTAFEASDYLSSFRIYASDLTTKFEKAKRRADFLISVEESLVDVLSDLLPAPILQKIAAHL